MSPKVRKPKTQAPADLQLLTRMNRKIAEILDLAEELQRLSGAVYWAARRRRSQKKSAPPG